VLREANSLLSHAETGAISINRILDHRMPHFDFLEAQAPSGSVYYERYVIDVMFVSVERCYHRSIPEYNPSPHLNTLCVQLCDALWFGNESFHSIRDLGIGPT